ncbi:beta-1,4-galactosyltransferase 4-like [Saccostrea cucullata]|uniref:beta-1,4-galactosyltransferase 4-like n=1 Tax=Saccostrea cuccullata TaxID=36930 RepID=UPI002ED0FB0D
MEFDKKTFRSVIFLLIAAQGIIILWFAKTSKNTPGYITHIHSYQQRSGETQIVDKSLEHYPAPSIFEIKGNRTLDLQPCKLVECITQANHDEQVTNKPCNPGICNDTECLNVNSPVGGRANKRTIIHTKNNRIHYDNDNCTSAVTSFAGENVIFGGHWKPTKYFSNRHVAIIIPFRDREEHLCILIKNLIPILIAQETEFRIFVIEQVGNGTFNKGRLMNAGFLEALKLFDFNCVFFHDVDLIPENDRNIYDCGDQPRHLSVSIDEDGYKLMYRWLVGGVLGFRPETFRRVNGYSNMFWGWGGEDDDMYHRIIHSKFRIIRPPSTLGRYTMIRHKKRERWSKRVEVLNTWKSRMKIDGLRNVPYKLNKVHAYTYYTKIRIDVGKPEAKMS